MRPPVDAVVIVFCVALMANGLVFSWGDGEEGKLGLGKPQPEAKPTMLDFLWMGCGVWGGEE